MVVLITFYPAWLRCIEVPEPQAMASSEKSAGSQLG